MFKTKATLSSTIGKVNSFIQDLKQGIDNHLNEVKDIDDEIQELVDTKTQLVNEVSQAKDLIARLGF